jgi:hypothetical protein
MAVMAFEEALAWPELTLDVNRDYDSPVAPPPCLANPRRHLQQSLRLFVCLVLAAVVSLCLFLPPPIPPGALSLQFTLWNTQSLPISTYNTSKQAFILSQQAH